MDLTGAAASRAWGTGFARRLRAGDLVFLRGPVGAGKTTLVQGVARGLGCLRLAPSPTFVLRSDLGGAPPLVHVDAYRLERPEQVEALDLGDALDSGVVMVEWPEMVARTGLEPAWTLELEAPTAGRRRLRVWAGRR